MLNAARASNYRDYVMLAVMASCGSGRPRSSDSGSGTCAKRRRIRSCFASSARVRKSATSRSHRNSGACYNASSLLTEKSFTSYLDSPAPVHLQGRQRQTTHHPLGPEHREEVRARGRYNDQAISPHSIRHTVGTNMAINEAPLLVIQLFLGHSDPKTTMRYIRRAEELATARINIIPCRYRRLLSVCKDRGSVLLHDP